jgi:hypothetical protein
LKKYLFEFTLVAAIGAIATIIGWIAVLSPPNSADAMAYHMPRVIYWAQSGSVAFFPTHFFNQIMLQPFTEDVMLHTYVLSGGDRFVNLVQFMGFLGSVVGVSSIAQALGLPARGQVFAALFCATLPNGILQASGAKNDYVLALWMVCLVYYAVRVAQAPSRSDIAFLGLSAGLALATKATAYLFGPPMLLAILFWGLTQKQLRPSRLPHIAASILIGTILINGPQYIRNFRLSGSILGYDSAQADGFFRWRNERFGWKSTVSNLLRNGSEQLGARSPRWNESVYETVVRLHGLLGIDPQDPDTTWRWAKYEPPRNANHEANANNRWHLLLLFAAAAPAIWFSWKFADKRWLIYCAGLAVGYAAFCFYLKWQPFLSRLELPLFVLASPLAGLLFTQLHSGILQVVVCLFLLNNTRPYLFENWTRPLKGPKSLLTTSRQLNYFRDMSEWNNRDSYLEAVEITARTGCTTVGIDISQYQLEYPFQALLRERNPSIRFIHMGVENASAFYYPAAPVQVCVVLCLDCAGNNTKLTEYSHVGRVVQIGRFLLFISA